MVKIKILVMDVDGTLTDGKIYMSDEGELFKAFDIKDGYGISKLLPKQGIIPVILTARESGIVKKRCDELGIEHCYQGCRDKKEKLIEIVKKFEMQPNNEGIYEEMAYIGDDIPDLSCMKLCEVVGCPANAADEVKEIAHFISVKNGGNGAVREFIEQIILRGKANENRT